MGNEARVGVIVQTPDEGETRADQLKVVREFVQSLRVKRGIVPGPGAQGLASGEYGVVDQLVYDDLVRTPDGTGPWVDLVNDEKTPLLSEVAAFVHARLR